MAAGVEAEAFYTGILKAWPNLKEADLDGVKRFMDFVLHRYGSAAAAAYMPDRIKACWAKVAEGLEQSGKYEAAAAVLKITGHLDKAQASLAKKAEVLEQSGKYEAAVPYWEKAGEPDKAKACWAKIAEGLERSGNLKAVPYWEKAGETEKAKTCWAKAAEGLEQSGKYEAAVPYWEKAGETEKAKACWAKAAEVLERSGGYAAAVSYREKAGNAGQARESLLRWAKKLKDDAGEDEKNYVQAAACCLMADDNAAAESLLDQAVALRKKKTFFSFLVGRHDFKDMLTAEKSTLDGKLAEERRSLDGRIADGKSALEEAIKQHAVRELEGFRFGSYKGECIEWRILDCKPDRMLLLSKCALDCKPYNEWFEGTTWEKCTLRQWLNGEFFNEAFSALEQERIILADVPAHKNPQYGTDPGNGTKDRVFLLSCKEAVEYLPEDAMRQCTPTEYAKAQGVGTNDSGHCWWWRLRSPGGNADRAASVLNDGSLFGFGDNVDFVGVAVRPALWIHL